MGRFIGKHTEFIQVEQAIVIDKLWIDGSKTLIMLFNYFLGVEIGLPFKLPLPCVMVFNHISQRSILDESRR